MKPTGGVQRGLLLLTREGCVNTARMRTNLEQALVALGRAPSYSVVDQRSLAPGDVRARYPTPTLLLNGRDVFGMPPPQPGAAAAT